MADGSTDLARLVEMIRAADHEGVDAALRSGASLSERDADDWSPLDLAAGCGDERMVRLLLDHGADPAATGGEQRTAYQIALAAGHLDAARVLREAELAAGASADRYLWHNYCRAYPLAELRRFPRWRELADDDGSADGDSVVFVHGDLTVTRLMWRDEDVLLADPTDEWSAFCYDQLGFRVPDDFDLVPGSPVAG